MFRDALRAGKAIMFIAMLYVVNPFGLVARTESPDLFVHQRARYSMFPCDTHIE
jgi:hypothetical protein